MTSTVTKRSGQTVKFDSKKIHAAISKAAKETGEMNKVEINQVAMEVVVDLSTMSNVPIETIQDSVEFKLAQAGFYKTAKAYVLYRQKHAERRNASQKLMEGYSNLLFADAEDMDLKRDNANINSDGSMGIMLKLGTEGAKSFVDNYFLSEDVAQADKENWIHIHDKDFSLITLNCCQIDLGKLFNGGFSTGHGFLREPNSVRSAASLACIAIQSNQNDEYGGQGIHALDFALAPYVKKSFDKTFEKLFNRTYRTLMNQEYLRDNQEIVKVKLNDLPVVKEMAHFEEAPVYWKGCFEGPGESLIHKMKQAVRENYAEKYDARTITRINCTIQEAYFDAVNEVEDEAKQAMEAMIHNFNTLHSRAGAQVPFSSINYGLDTSPEGRLVIRMTLEAIWNGLGNGETPIFPISVFQIKAGVNYNQKDPNYDLFQRACEVSAKRLFPNFVNIDAPYNLKYYKPGDPNSAVATMGCRTRVMSNVNGPEESGSRGNFAFTTLNLPMIALEAKRLAPENPIKKFYELMDKYTLLSRDYLKLRYEVIAKKHVYNFPFLMGQGVWMDSEKLNMNDEIREVLKHASISIGFCGLAECLVALTGSHHGVSEDAQRLGLEIVGHLRDMTDKFTKEEHMNWSCFATPAESTAGSFARACKKRFGIIPGVTDRDYLTNSFHVPVYHPIKAINKVKVEAPYHALCNAGHISYIEMNGDPTKNVKAFEKLVRAMHDADMGYFSINHPVDRDPVCGYTGIIENECPHCHRKETTTVNTIKNVRRAR